ncbi:MULTISPECIES: hypothetical protein [Pandoraea]|jgi:hypothetical protein|uniref:Uncharacterized protein n=1 Tax=Pandoraea pnomenusa TaxID=93220 RepID=A0A378YDB1_9BURK|nr:MULTISPECIES: hypothetical protein [Pandoraea]AHB08463.1 hypothetical protein U875_12480 [Pandoraea pnomenusa 3kgm]AHB78742.1 hypothetical protein X636_22215 [Pandoraea pnomenusa]AIU25394.1 hypothetical protein LV28_01380 [Pandoraea pnomenusa]ANC46505.1 hypothetical protein A6P55_22325 [Pandoraea pnomenusa]MBN9092355.1 hypothetical protein [Pandoraea pnomenusa]
MAAGTVKKVRRYALETIDVMGQSGLGVVERPDGRFVMYPEYWTQTQALSQKMRTLYRRNCQLEYQLAKLTRELDRLRSVVDTPRPTGNPQASLPGTDVPQPELQPELQSARKRAAELPPRRRKRAA